MRYVIFLYTIFLISGCDSHAPPNPTIQSVQWIEFIHPELGYSI